MPTRFLTPAPRRSGAFARFFGALASAAFLLLGLGWSSSASATFGCAIQVVTPPPQSQAGRPGDSFTFKFRVTESGAPGGCTGANGTVNVVQDQTNHASSSNLPTWSGPVNTEFTFTVPTGSGFGLDIWAANCRDCNGNANIQYDVTASNSYSFVPVLPADGDEVYLPGTTATLQARALANGVTPVVSRPVGWLGTGPGTVVFNPPTTATDPSGLASVDMTVSVPGTYAVTGRYCNPESARLCIPVDVSFTIHFGAFIAKVSGDGQQAIQGGALANPLKVQARNGSSVLAAGVAINWSVQSGAGSATINSTSGNTDVNGEATANITLNGPPGSFPVIRAARADHPSIFTDFTLEVVDDYSLAASGPVAFTANPGEVVPLAALYRVNNNPSPHPVNWTASPSGGTFTFASTVPNAGTGIASTGFSANSVGNYTITATGQCPARQPDCTSTPPVTYTVAVVNKTLAGSGNVQGYPGQAFLLTAQALDNGSPIDGVNVVWAVSGPGTPAGGTVVTSGGGNSEFTVTLGASVGSTVTVTATRQDNSAATVSFTLAIVAPNLTAISGSGQSGYEGASALAPLVVELRDGKTGNAVVQDATINWSVVSGPAILNASSSVTNAAGRTSVTFRFGPFDGDSTIRATDALTGLAIADFTAHTIDPNLLKIDGDGQTGSTNAAFPIDLAVRALDDGVAVGAGKEITWTVLSGSATVSVPTQATDANGESRVTVTAGSAAGPITVRATRSDNPTVIQVFSLTSVVPTLELEEASGNGQSGLPNSDLPQPLVVHATDGGDDDAGVTVNWAVASGSATLSADSSVTGINGLASIGVRLGATPGPVVITATRSDEPLAVVTFNLLVKAPSLLIHDGNGQSGAVGTTLPQNLVVEARNDGVAVDGVDIAWTLLSGDAVLGSCCATTIGGGFAGISVQLGSTPGAISIKAERSDAPGVAQIFTLTSFIAREFFIESGDNQEGAPGADLALPLVVHARDSSADSAGVTINWQVTSGAATLAADTSVTGAGGLASMDVTLGNTSGPVTISATRGDDATFTRTFRATVLVGQKLVVVSGNSQSGVIASAADAPLVVRLTGVGGGPLAGQVVSWQLSGPGSLAAPTSLTNADGVAQIGFSFGATPGSITVVASALDGAVSASFNASSVMAEFAASSGNNQSGPVNTTLPLPFVVRINEPVGALSVAGGRKPQALSGVPVVWAVTGGGGVLSVTNTVTNEAGEASSTLTLGPTAGANTVTATIPGGPTRPFTATAFVPTGNLAIVSGNNQTLPTNTNSAPLRVRLTTSANAPAPGITIRWSGSNATVASETCVTNAQGECSITATVDLPGEASVSASSANPLAGPLQFSLNGGVAKLPGLTESQNSIAEAIDRLCPMLSAMSHDESPGGLNAGEQDLLQRCLEIVDAAGLDPQAAIAALEELFPNVALVQASAALHAAQAQFDNLKARIAALRSGTHGTSFGGLALNTSTGSIPLSGLMGAFTQDGTADATTEVGADFGRWGFFASGSIGRGEADPGTVSPAYDFDINGLTVGVDYRKSDKLILGAAAGFTRQDTVLPNADGSLDTSGWSLSGYSTYYQENSWYVDGVATWGRNTYDVVRIIRYTLPLPGGGTRVIDQRGRMSTEGDLLSGALTFGRDFNKGGWGFGPYGRLLYTRLTFEDSVERLGTGPGSGLGFAIETRDVTSLTTTLGGKMTYTHSTDWGVLMPHFTLEWERELKDDPAGIEARFLNDPTGTPIVITADPLDQSFFRLGLGLSMVLTNSRSGFILYERMIGRDGLEQDNLALGFRMEF